MKKRNNSSVYFKDWDTRKLKKIAKECYCAIYETECYSRKDLMELDGILNELKKRGIEANTTLTFN